MASSVEKDQLEKAKAEQFIAEVPLLAGVEDVRVELGEDSTGDEAMWLIFRLKPEVKVDREWASHFNEYAAVIQTKILHGGLVRFPYTRLERVA
jgi:hypothetical protein